MGSFSPTIFSLTTHPTPAIMIKIVVLLSVLGLALSAPLPDDAAPAVLPYVLPYHAGVYPYAGLPVVYAAPAPLDSGLVYPVAEAYVHDPAGDESDNSYPAAEVYVHDPTGDA